MAASPGWYDSSNVALAAPLAISGTGGSAGTAVVFKLINNKGGVGASAITNARLIVAARANGSSDAYVYTGIDALDRHFLEIQVTGGYGTLTATATGWRQVGAGKPFDGIPTSIANDEGVAFEIRSNAPADTGDVDLELKLILIDDRNTIIGQGVSIAGVDGIYCGYGEEDFSVLVSASDVVEDNAGASNDVDISETVAIVKGKPYTFRAQELTIAASTAATSRYVLVYISSSAAIAQTAGSEVAGALTDADKPAIPAGALPLCWVARDDSATIVNADITNFWTLGLFPFTSSSLTATIGMGPYAFVDSALLYASGSANVTLTASVTNYVWLKASGSLERTSTEASPDGKALLLYTATTDGAGVTALVDNRFVTGNAREFVTFTWSGEIDASSYRYAHAHNPRTAYLSPLRPVSASLGSQGSGTGASTVWEVDVLRAGTFTAAFTAAADGPTIAYNAAATAMVDATAVPDTWSIPPFARLRAKHNAIPSGSGGVEPNDSALTLEILL